MERGNVKSADILPIVRTLLDNLSSGGIEAARRSSGAEQARLENAILGRGGLLELFSKGGGEEAFASIFRTIGEGARSAEPLVRGLTGTFQTLAEYTKVPVSLFQDFNRVLEETSKASGISEGALTNLAIVGGLLATKWGRVAILFGGFLAVLQDISYGVQGKDSYTKDLMTWFESLSETEKYLLGVAGGLTAIATAIALVNKEINNRPDIGGKGKKGKMTLGGSIVDLVSSGARGNPAIAGAVAVGGGLAAAGAPVFEGIGGIKPGLTFVPPPTIPKDAPINGIFPLGYGKDPAAFAARVRAVGDPSSPYYNDPKGYDTQRTDALAAMQQQNKGSVNQFSGPLVQLDVKIDGTAETEDWVQNKLKPLIEGVLDDVIDRATVNFPSR